MSPTRAIPSQACPGCGALLSAIGGPDGSSPNPKPGDPVMCSYCGSVSTISADGMLRPLTEPEALRLTNAEGFAELKKLLAGIRIRAMRQALNMALRRS